MESCRFQPSCAFIPLRGVCPSSWHDKKRRWRSVSRRRLRWVALSWVEAAARTVRPGASAKRRDRLQRPCRGGGRFFDLRVVESYSDENAIAGLIQCPLDENDPMGDRMHPTEHRIHRPPRETLPIAERFHCPRSEIHPKAGRIRAIASHMNTIDDRVNASRDRFASQLDSHSPTATGREASAAELTSVTRPYSTSTWTWEPIAKPCSASHRPDMRRYGTIASGIIRRDMRRLANFTTCGARAGRGFGSTADGADTATCLPTRRRRGRLNAG